MDESRLPKPKRQPDPSKLPRDLDLLRGSFDVGNIKGWMFHEGWPEFVCAEISAKTIPPESWSKHQVPQIIMAALEDAGNVVGRRGLVVLTMAGLMVRKIPGHVRGRDDVLPPALQVAFYAREEVDDKVTDTIKRYGFMAPIPQGMPWDDFG